MLATQKRTVRDAKDVVEFNGKVWKGIYAVAIKAALAHCRDRGYHTVPKRGKYVSPLAVEDAASEAVAAVMQLGVKDGVFVGIDKRKREELIKDVERLAKAYVQQELRKGMVEQPFSSMVMEVEDEDNEYDISVLDYLQQAKSLEVNLGDTDYDEGQAENLYSVLRSLIESQVKDKRRRDSLLRCLEAVFTFAKSRYFNLEDLTEIISVHCGVTMSSAWRLLQKLRNFFAIYENDAKVSHMLLSIFRQGGEKYDN